MRPTGDQEVREKPKKPKGSEKGVFSQASRNFNMKTDKCSLILATSNSPGTLPKAVSVETNGGEVRCEGSEDWREGKKHSVVVLVRTFLPDRLTFFWTLHFQVLVLSGEGYGIWCRCNLAWRNMRAGFKSLYLSPTSFFPFLFSAYGWKCNQQLPGPATYFSLLSLSHCEGLCPSKAVN